MRRIVIGKGDYEKMVINKGNNMRGRCGRRRGQMQQVFSFILMAIIAGGVILLGYKFISSWVGGVKSIETTQLSKSLVRLTNKYTTFGDYHPERIAAPSGVKKICLISATAFSKGPNGYRGGNPEFDNSVPSDPAFIRELLSDAVSDPDPTTPNNVFLITDDNNMVPVSNLFLSKVVVGDSSSPPGQGNSVNVVCFDAINGFFEIGFYGEGRYVRLKPLKTAS